MMEVYIYITRREDLRLVPGARERTGQSRYVPLHAARDVPRVGADEANPHEGLA
jgi:hypothetical protein